MENEMNVAIDELGLVEAAGNVATGFSYKKVGAGEIVVLGFAGAGVIATGYFGYKGIKWLIGKFKAKKASKAIPEVTEEVAEAPAEESTEE